MKVPYRWLRELVATDAMPAEVAGRLVMAGIEVASVSPGAPELTGVVVGEVLEVTRHPAADALAVCQVTTGASRFQVVCGAPNVRAGVRAAFAPPGTVLPGGRRIATTTIRGAVSEGMLCSEAELRIGEDAAGILLLDAEAPLGADLAGHLGLDDAVLEVEVTPNRPDCLSVLGVAREVAAVTKGRALRPAVALVEEGPPAADLAAVSVEDEDLCPRYAARVIVGVTVGPSPAWLAQRLRAAGLRPINNVVDVTNYVLWELGHPLHAFDADRVVGRRIVVRRAQAGEVLVTLDGQRRTLTEAMLVIADAEGAIAVAGVMGGANTEVGAMTRTVLLESAYFKPASVRRTAKALGLVTEASYRFERGADIEEVPKALDRAAQLIAELAGGRVAPGAIDVYGRPRPARSLRVRLARIERLIGACPPKAVVGETLRGLGFPTSEWTGEAGGGFEVVVPSFRRDVSIEDDLVEEVVRIWGYGEIPSTIPSGALALTRRPRHVVSQDAVRRALAAAGCQEAVTLALVDPARLEPLGWPADDPRLVRLQNPLAADRSVLRPTLLTGLLEAMATNVRRQAPAIRLFEIGRIFEARGPGELPHEDTRVGIALTGLRTPRAWFAGKTRVDVYDVKGTVETVLEALGRGDVTSEPTEAAHLEEGRGATVLVAGIAVGRFGELHPRIRQAFDLSEPVFVGEVSLDRLEATSSRPSVHRPLPRFPAIQRDLAVVVPTDVPAADVSRLVQATPTPWLRRVLLFDVYQGDQVGPGRKSLAYSLLYQAEDRTLTDAEVNATHAQVVERLRAELGAEIRGVAEAADG